VILGSSVLAHGIGGREDLPLPLGWAIAGAAAAVVVSFLALAVLWREPRLGTGGWARGRPLPRAVVTVLDAPAARRVVTALSLLVTAWVLLALVLGRDDARNPVPWVVYVLLWVGLVPVSVLLGPVWRVLNPLRALHAGLNRLLGLDPREGLRPLPSRLGYWPAALGLLAFTWLELVAPDNAELATLRTAVGLYAAVQLFCALLWGGRWFDRGDAFEVWSDLFGRLSPLGRRPDGTRVLRPPVVGLDLLPAAPGLAATVVVMLGSTAYDGLAGSTAWVGWVQAQALPRTLLGTAGLLGTVLLVGLLYAACAAAAGVVAGVGPRGMAAQFAPSVVPVALGYVVAHYYSLLVLEGQRAFVRLSDPLGTGADWLGTGSLTPSSALVTPTIVANVMVGSIVVGHVLGVMLAHDRAVRLFPRRRAVPGQLPLLVLMVSLTCLGLFLLFYD
jgi:hypothetical protein